MGSHFDSDQEWQFWLKLLSISGIGNQTARKLLQEFGPPQKVLGADVEYLKILVPEAVAHAIVAAPNAEQEALIARTAQWLDADDAHIIYLGHPAYPQTLLEIPDPPLMLYAKGKLEYLQRDTIAVVGSRNASVQGKEHALAFATALSQSAWCISSGLAAGIDAAAHQGGLAGAGGTIAVIGTGIDIVYPARHRDLAHRVVEHGCILSEYHLGTPAVASNFPRRNRIISGLAKGVLVVEAAEKSGSLITARMAAEQGREVFAIPGSIHSPLAKGCHLLIKQGAKLVECANDILEELSFPLQLTKPKQKPLATTDDLLLLMGYDPVSFEVLLERGTLDSANLQARIFELELEGVVEMLPGGFIRRIQ